MQRNRLFLVVCADVASIAGRIGARDAAQAAYRHIAGMDHVFAANGAAYGEPVGVGAGLAATSLGQFDRAEQHFAAAVRLCEKANAPCHLATTKVSFAEMLVRRDGSGDGGRATDLARQALDTAEQLGMGDVRSRAEKVLA